MFAHQRKKIQLLYAIADGVLTIAAFEAAYAARVKLLLAQPFYLELHVHLLLLGFCVLVWIASGWVQRTYEYLDSANSPRVIAKALRQAGVSAGFIVLFQYLLRLELSRSFLSIFLCCDLALVIAFRAVCVHA